MVEFPQKLMGKFNPLCNSIKQDGFRRGPHNRGRLFPIRESLKLKGTPFLFVCFSIMWIQHSSSSEDVVTWQSSPGTIPTGALVLYFQVFRILKSKCLFFKSFPICGVLWQQCKHLKTAPSAQKVCRDLCAGQISIAVKDARGRIQRRGDLLWFLVSMVQYKYSDSRYRAHGQENHGNRQHGRDCSYHCNQEAERKEE